MYKSCQSYCFWLILLLVAASVMGTNNNTVEFEWGNNIWGNSVAFGYQRRLTKNIGVGVGFQRGYVHFETKSGERFFTYQNSSSDDHQMTMEFKQILDLILTFKIREGRQVRLFNTWGLGLSHYFVTFRYSYTRSPYPGLFRAEQDISKFVLYFAFSIIEYRPNLDGPFKFALGVKTRTAFMKSPLLLNSENIIAGIRRIDRIAALAPFKTLVIPYPEMYIRIGYSF